jgi:hypothetical protein
VTVSRNGTSWTRLDTSTSAPPSDGSTNPPSTGVQPGPAFTQAESEGRPVGTTENQEWYAPDTGNTYTWRGGAWVQKAASFLVPKADVTEFPEDPIDGQTTPDGFYVWYPPGVWRTVLDPDLQAIASANNGAILAQITSPFTVSKDADLSRVAGGIDTVEQRVEALSEAAEPWSAIVLDDVTGVVTPPSSYRGLVDIGSTAGNWTLNLSGMPQDRPATVFVKIDSSGAHTPTFPAGVVWDGGSAPSGTLWAAGKRAVIRFTRVPFTNQVEGKLMASGDTPDTNDTGVVDPPDLTFQYSLSATRTSLTTLAAATLPYQPVAIVVGPLDAKIKHVDLWHAHSGSLPAVGSEATVDSYIGRRTSYPYDFLGADTNGNAFLWDTAIDPTGNNRTLGTEQTIRARATYIDDSTAEFTVTFNVTPPPTADPFDVTYGSSAIVGTNPSVDLTIPGTSDRAVIAVAVYQATFDVTGATLGGNAMTVLQSAYDAGSDAGIIVLRANEAQMPAAGTRALALTHSGSEGANTLTHIHYWIIEGAPSAEFGATTPVVRGGAGALDVALAVPGSAAVFTVAGHRAITAALTNNWDGTAETQLVTDAVFDMNSQAEWKSDAGAAGTVSVQWTATGTWGQAVMVYLSADTVSGPPPTPITPGTPTLTATTTPADNTLRTTWTATANAVSYEGRIGTTNPPTTVPIALGNVTEWSRNGLLPSTQYHMQVRAVSSDGTRSAWSNVVSGTTNASTVVVQPISQDRLIHGNFTDLNAITGSFGSHRTDGVLVPNWWHNANLHSTAGVEQAWNVVWNQSKVGSNTYNNAMNAWAQNAAARPAGLTAVGQRTFLQVRLSKDGHPRSGTQPSGAVLAALDMARSGSKGTDNRNAQWKQMGADLALWPGRVIVGLSHESNGPWYSNYSGVNPNLIGSTTLANVPNSQFGTEMGAALRQVAVDGNLATVHRLAFEHAAEQIWSGGPNVIISYTLTGNASSVPPGQTIGDFSTSWQPSAHPRPEFFDVFSQTLYCRGTGRPIYKGTGSVDATSSYTYNNLGVNSQAHLLAQQWNRPLGYWELGANWDVFDWAPTYTDGPSDNQSSIWWKMIAETFPQLDMAFLIYWHAGGDRATGSTYQLPEANYGYQKSSGTNPRFPKTLTQLRAIY